MNIVSWQKSQFESLSQRVGMLPHAMLFTGAPGIGKRAFAFAVAAGLLCERRAGPLKACGVCQSCHWLETGNHADFRLVQPELAETTAEEEPTSTKKKNDISIAQVRSLADFINISSHRSGAKVIIVQPAEAMNVNAANALLKNLEEPPPATYFLLVSDRPHMLPATIRSRCQQLGLRMPTPLEATQWLAEQGVTEPDLALAQAGGAPMLAQQLDTPDYWAARRQFLDGLSARDFDPVALAARFASHSIPQIINWLQRWTYDLACAGAGQALRYNPDRQKSVQCASACMQNIDILRFHRELVRFQRIVNHPLNARLLLEDLLLRYAQLLRNCSC